MIDTAHLAELDAVLGRATTDTLIAPMLTELASAPIAILEHSRAGDIAAVRSTAHALRGAALNLGCTAVADLCGRIEDGAADALPELAAELTPLAAATAYRLTRARP